MEFFNWVVGNCNTDKVRIPSRTKGLLRLAIKPTKLLIVGSILTHKWWLDLVKSGLRSMLDSYHLINMI